MPDQPARRAVRHISFLERKLRKVAPVDHKEEGAFAKMLHFHQFVLNFWLYQLEIGCSSYPGFSKELCNTMLLYLQVSILQPQMRGIIG